MSTNNSSGTGSVNNTLYFKAPAAAALAPTLTSINPNSVVGLNALRTFTLTGSGFVNGAKVQVAYASNGYTYVDTTNAPTSVSATQIVVAFNTQTDVDTWKVRVKNPDNQTSGFVNLAVTAPAAPAPTLSTLSATFIGTSSAVLNGRVTSDGGSSISERRFDWGTNSGVLNLFTSAVAVSGSSFSYNLTGLAPNTTYYFRAWAKNGSGWGNGVVLSFTTAANPVNPPTLTSINPNSVVGLNALRTFTLTGSGFVNGTKVQVGYASNGYTYVDTTNAPTSVSATQIVVAFNTQTDVDTWKVRVKNPDNQTSGFVNLAVTAPAAPAPTLSTLSATFIGTSSAVLNGRVTSDGGSSISERRFDWGTNSGVLNLFTSAVAVSGSSFSYNLTGLAPNTTYYFRAWAKNGSGWGNGVILSFTTAANPVNPPTLTSINPSSVVRLNALRTFTLTGSGFVNGAKVQVGYAGNGYTFVDTTSAPSSVTATQIIVAFNTQTAVDTWRVRVKNPNGQTSDYVNLAVTAPATWALQLSSPNGGERWTPGSTRSVTWTITGSASNIAYYKVALSTDGGASWPTTNSDARQLTPNGLFYPGDRSWNWTIPTALNNSALRIRVCAFDSGGNILAEKTSNANFAVTPTTAPLSIALSSPNGGETWTAGGTGAINWTIGGNAAQISSFRIDYSLNSGSTWILIPAAVLSSGTGSYLWNVPATLTSTDARIRVRALNSSGIEIAFDSSAADFTIAAAGANPVARPDCSNNAPASGDLVSFDGIRSTPAGSIVSYSWDFGDGPPIVTGRNVSHRFTNSNSTMTNYIVRLTVTDNAGRTSTGLLTVSVNGNAVGETAKGSMFADPVNLATGNFTYDHTDLRIPAPGLPFEFKRFYNSKDPRPSPIPLPLGYGWNHSYNVRLAVDPLSSTRTITFGDSRSERYEPIPGGVFTAEAGIFSTLTAVATGHVLTTKTQTAYRFDTQDRLTSIVDKNGNATALTYGATGNLDTVTDSAGRTVQFAYDASQRIISLTDALARVIRFAYDAAGNLSTVTDANGGVAEYRYDAEHQMTAALDAEGNQFVTNEYDPNQRIVALQKDALGNQTLFEYDFVTRLTTVTEPLQRKSEHRHDDKLRVISITNALHQVEAYEYDNANNRIMVTDKKNGVTRYGYDNRGNVTSKTDALLHTTSIEYDARNNPVKRTDALGGVTTFTYDAKGNLTTSVDATGATSSITYNPTGLPLTQVNPLGHTRTFSYDAAGNLEESMDALGNKSQFTYDAVGRKLTEKDALNRTATFDYDLNDNLRTLTDPAGVVTSTYDANNNRRTTRDRRGHTTTFTYDAKDRLAATKDALNQTVSTTYDALDRKTAVTDARLNTTQYTYDSIGNLVKVTDPLGKFAEFGYDANGNRTSVKNPLGNTTSFTYDALNRVVETQDSLLHKSKMKYDALGRKTKATDANGKATAFVYDGLGRLLKVTDANGGNVTYVYDAAGNRVSMTDPNNNTTTYTYDELNRLVQTKDPSNGVHEHRYDAVGNLVSRKDAKNQTTTYAYDTSNRRTGITYPAGAPVTFTYDENGNRTGMTDALGASVYVYDALSRMTGETDAYGKTVGYGYDPNGNRLSITYPGNKTVSYTYDVNNRMKTVTDWLPKVTSYSYDDAGNLTDTVNPNATTAAYSYDTAGRLTGLANAKADSTVIANYALTLDAVGNHTQVTQNEPLLPVIEAGNTNYAYDNDNRLTNVGATACTYDANGNLTARGADTYGYDFENRLTQSMIAGATSQYQYDGVGNRKQVLTANGAKRFVLTTSGSLSHLLAETDGTGMISAYYIYGRGLVARVAADGASRYYHYDVRGSAVALSDTAGVLTDGYAYDPFGTIANNQGVTASPFKYVGKYGIVDEGNGLAYIRARYFSPAVGRFITKDPLTGTVGESQSLHRYVYAMNNPVTFVDISGFSRSETSTLLANNGTPSDSDPFHLKLINPESQVASVSTSIKPVWKWIGNTAIGIAKFIADNAGNLFKLKSEGFATKVTDSPAGPIIGIGITVLEHSPEILSTQIQARKTADLERQGMADFYKEEGYTYEKALAMYRQQFPTLLDSESFRNAWDNAPAR